MAKTAERKLSSEERCRKAFDAWYGAGAPTEYEWRDPLRLQDKMLAAYREACWVGFKAAWEVLESRVEEYVKS